MFQVLCFMTKLTFKNFLKLVNPQPEIGGLEICDSYLRFVLLKDGKANFVSVKLPPGIIENGRIKDSEQFFSIASNFYKKISPKNKKVYVIANISDANVYTEMFFLPKTGDNHIEETINLNLRMISPIDYESAYVDWQPVSEKIVNGMPQMEILGSFVNKQIIDEFETILLRAGFEVVAIEFSLLSLVRSIMDAGEGVDKNKNYILMRVGGDGLAFGFIKNGNLYFSRFISWFSIYGGQRQISFDDMKNTIISEVQKVLSFYETRSSGEMGGLFLISQALTDEISKIVSESFPKLQIKIPTLREFKNMESIWFGVVGSAIRGIIPRSEDSFISLSSSGTEEKFKNYQILAFVEVWTNVILTFFGAILIFLGILDFFLMKNSDVLDEKVKAISINPDFSIISSLQAEAINFNQKAELLDAANSQKIIWSSFISQIMQFTGEDITIKRILVQSLDAPVLLVGEADNEDKVIAFKDNFASQAKISNVNLQLSNIVKSAEGKINFSITFEMKK